MGIDYASTRLMVTSSELSMLKAFRYLTFPLEFDSASPAQILHWPPLAITVEQPPS